MRRALNTVLAGPVGKDADTHVWRGDGDLPRNRRMSLWALFTFGQIAMGKVEWVSRRSTNDQIVELAARSA